MGKATFTWDIDGYADQTMRVVLDSQTYEMRFQWNERDESWLVYFGDVGSDPTISFKLTAFVDFFASYQYLENIPLVSLWLFLSPTTKKGSVGIISDSYPSYNCYMSLQMKSLRRLKMTKRMTSNGKIQDKNIQAYFWKARIHR